MLNKSSLNFFSGTTKEKQESSATHEATPQQKKTSGSGRNSRWKYEGLRYHIKAETIRFTDMF
jgi:hypothetical protein